MCVVKVHLAELVEITNPLDDSPFGLVHHLSALAFSKFKLYNFGRYSTASRNYFVTHQLLLYLADLIFSFRAWHTGTLGETMAIRCLVPFCKIVSMLFTGTKYAFKDTKSIKTKPQMSPNRGLINTPNLNFCLSSSKTQVQQFKKDVSNSATLD
ncbi:hypothetical protein H5410_027209 [Solanum commersonii]|uniref:Uncharacterized protein n=1 Tax=Solanum commersonii TaxID=4109 RepID=A0A9J5Z0N3_SOLCO|nr:hypothetical protein H5410_027209 [Solanum commersonii]